MSKSNKNGSFLLRMFRRLKRIFTSLHDNFLLLYWEQKTRREWRRWNSHLRMKSYSKVPKDTPPFFGGPKGVQ